MYWSDNILFSNEEKEKQPVLAKSAKKRVRKSSGMRYAIKSLFVIVYFTVDCFIFCKSHESSYVTQPGKMRLSHNLEN